MGHHVETSTSLNHRQALVAQTRLGTFVLVFSVALIAFTMTISALQNRASRCQDRAREILFDHYLRPDISRGEIAAVMQDVLVVRRSTLDITAKEAAQQKMKSVDVYDTSDSIISSRGLRLLRQKDGNNYRWEMRHVQSKLCDTFPPVSMEMLPNADYEKAAYHIKAIGVPKGTTVFILESSLTTKDGNRIATLQQLQSLFPGFQQFTGANRLTAQKTFEYTVGGNAQVYYNGVPLDIIVQVQQWFSKGTPIFWRVTFSTENMLAEKNLISLDQSMRTAFEGKSMHCTSSSCTETVDAYLR